MKRIRRAPFGFGIIGPEHHLRRKARDRSVERGRQLEARRSAVAPFQVETEMARSTRRTVVRNAYAAEKRFDECVSFHQADVSRHRSA